MDMHLKEKDYKAITKYQTKCKIIKDEGGTCIIILLLISSR